MRIIYLHHSYREFGDKIDNLKCGLTPDGITVAEIVGKSLNIKIEKIVSSEFRRCLLTSEIINKYANTTIEIDTRLNEFRNGRNDNESFVDMLKRTHSAVDDICKQYSGTDKDIICVSSGVNLTAFVCHYYNIPIDEKTRVIQHGGLAPIIFDYK